MAGFQPRLTSGSRKTRAELVADAIQQAVHTYASAINAAPTFRSVNIDVKFKNDGSGVRTVIVSLQGETELDRSGS